MRRARCAMFVLLCLTACESGAESEKKPETFMDYCETDAGTCEDPYRCIPVTGASVDQVNICTKPCERTSECPKWFNESGHCAGDFQAVCLEGFCQAWCI